MADPLAIIGVIGVAVQIIGFAAKLGLDWKDAPADIKRVMTEIQVLKTVLSETHANILINDDFKNAFHGRHSTLLTQVGDMAGSTDTNIMVSACKRELDDLHDDLKKRVEGHRMGWDRLKGAFLARKVKEAVENLHRQCATLNSLVVVDALALVAHTHKEVTDARKEQQSWQAGREDKAILDWITTADYSTQQSDFIRRRQAGTGQWLLNSAEYHQWTETSQKTLFCPGIPGAGKTILISIVIEDLYIRFRDNEHVGIAFLYCNFRRQTEQKVEDLLSSLLKQLSQNHTSLPECVRSLYSKHIGKTRPTLEELSRALQTVAKIFSRSFIVVDALDECQLSDGSRHKFLTEVFALQTTSRANFIATSRYIQNITEIFKDSVLLDIRARPEDVWRYLEGNMAHMPSCIDRSPELQAEIITKIVEAVDGMFLLAQLHLDSLKGKRSPKAVRSALRILNDSSRAYDRAYNDAMERIEGQRKDEVELAKQVLSWITCAKRPLSTIELQHALGVEVGETELDLDNISQIEDMMSVCAGLVTVDEESNIIRLVHCSTQEYFMRTWKRWFAYAQMEITEVCATYLSFSSFEAGFCRTDADFEDRLRLHPLYDYVAHFWGDHAREAGETSHLVLCLLRNEKNIEAQVQALWMAKETRLRGYSQCFPMGTRGLHVTAYFGLEKAGKELLNSGDRLDMKDGYGRTPLSWAAGNGREAMAKMLLDTEQVDVDSRDSNGQTPLLWAAAEGREAIVKVLLDKEKVDINSRDSEGQTPLSWAAIEGYEAVVKVLLDKEKVDVNSRDSEGQTPLSWAAIEGYEAVVKMLLDKEKVDVNSRDGDGQTPLSWAALNGNEAVVKVLLDKEKVDVNSKDTTFDRTPLWWAIVKGHEAVVKILLDKEQVDVNSKDTTYGRTPLWWAIVNGREAVVKILLDKGQVDGKSKDTKYWHKLLFWAAANGCGAVVKILSTSNSNIDAEDAHSLTTLQLSAFNGGDEVEELLSAYDAPVLFEFDGLQSLFLPVPKW